MLALVALCLPSVVRACPMCFTGNNEDAFLYGSLFLMIVPVSAIGGLLYWAYRRIKASEAASALPEEPPPAVTGRPAALRAVEPR